MKGPSLTFFGTGTSLGVPINGCHCDVCTSSDPRDKRFRSAALVRWNGLKILVDAGPDFRMQMLAHDIGHLDAILLTHHHKDHTSGLDDVRALNYIDRRAMEIYCEQRVQDYLKVDFAYAFAENKYPGSPEWHIHVIDDKPFRVFDTRQAPALEWVHDVGYRYMPVEGPQAEPASVEVVPIRGFHDQLPVLGFRFGDIAYITDMSRLPEEELPKLQGLRHLTLNTVSYKPHHSHFSLDEAIALSERIGADHTWLTHLSHTFPRHEAFCRYLAERTGGKVQAAYDGLTIE